MPTMDLKKSVDKIMCQNVRELHSQLEGIKTKIGKTAIELIQIYGENLVLELDKGRKFVASNGVVVGGELSFKDDELLITQYTYDEEVEADEESEYLFQSLDIDLQIRVLDRITENYAK